MSFATKGYTISYFVSLFSSTRGRTLTSASAVYTFVSPRLGAQSTRAKVLNTWLGNQTNNIINGTGKFSSYGATPRARILKALRNRKANGSV